MSRQQTHLLVLLGALCGLSACASAPVPAIPETPDLAGILNAAGNADTSVVAITQPAPCCKRQTLPEFLGINGLFRGLGGLANRVRNRLGMTFPGLEATPPLLAITDPANMSEDAPPSAKAAAEIKAQEDGAAQKVKGLRYLATIGCGGCYPDVEEALIAAMDDCTEEVRYEAVLAVRKTTGTPCCYCSCDACCSEKIQNKLRDLTSDKRPPGCDGEPSARVRRQARIALAECGPPAASKKPVPVEGPTEGPGEGPSDGDQEGKKDKKESADDVASVLPAPTTGPAAVPAPSAATASRPLQSNGPRPEASPKSFRDIESSPWPLSPAISQ